MTPLINKPPLAAGSSHASAEDAASHDTTTAYTAYFASLLARANRALPGNEDLAQDAVGNIFVRYFKVLLKGDIIENPIAWLTHALRTFEIPAAIKSKTSQGHWESTDPELLDAIAASQPITTPDTEFSPEDLEEIQSCIADMCQPAGLTKDETEVMRVHATVTPGIIKAGDLDKKQTKRAINEAIAARLGKDIKTVAALKSKALKKLKTYQVTI